MPRIERDPTRPAKDPVVEALKEELLEALESVLGIASTACHQVNVPYKRYRKWLMTDPEFKRAAEAITDITIDFVETQLFRQIQEGNTQATMFYLRTKAKHRGYVETPLLNIDTINPIQILLPNGVNPPELPTIDITPDEDDNDDE
jgi:hypothetical protein